MNKNGLEILNMDQYYEWLETEFRLKSLINYYKGTEKLVEPNFYLTKEDKKNFTQEQKNLLNVFRGPQKPLAAELPFLSQMLNDYYEANDEFVKVKSQTHYWLDPTYRVAIKERKKMPESFKEKINKIFEQEYSDDYNYVVTNINKFRKENELKKNKQKDNKTPNYYYDELSL